MKSDWEVRAVCKCGYHTYAPFGKLFHAVTNCCPKCGAVKPDGMHFDFTNNWELKTMRFISTCVWWKPSTWNSGYWETKEKS